MKNKNIFLLIGIFLLSFLFSFKLSYSENNFKNRNDIDAYKSYYLCLDSNSTNIEQCNSLIGNPLDIIFQIISIIINKVLLLDFSYFLFGLSFTIFFTILLIVYKNSSYFIVSLLFILTDFRFYEFATNTLRAGIAISIVLVIYNFILHKRESYFLIKFIPSLAHMSAIFFMFCSKKSLTVKSLLLGILFSLVIYSLLTYLGFYLLETNYNGYSILNKIKYYYKIKEENHIVFKIPMHYIAIILISFFFYLKRNKYNAINDSDNRIITYTLNIIYILLMFTIISTSLGMAYRYIGFLLPFIAILLSYEYKIIINIKKDLWYKSMIISAYILFVVIMFIHNYKFIVMKF